MDGLGRAGVVCYTSNPWALKNLRALDESTSGGDTWKVIGGMSGSDFPLESQHANGGTKVLLTVWSIRLMQEQLLLESKTLEL